MTWDNTYFGNNEKMLILWDVNQQLAVDMRRQNQYQFSKNASTKLQIIYGNEGFVREKTRANMLIFQSISPNPVTDEADFVFTLPTQADVTIDVLDITGNKVQTVFDGMLDEGQHRVKYRSRQQHVAKGMYIVQLKAGSKVLLKRMILE
jgi:hypothetical protein